MAETNTTTAARKLPPLSPRPKNSESGEPAKPIRKKKKKPVSETGTGSGTEDAKPTPRRRRRTPSASRDTEGEKEQETTETITETTAAPRKKKKKPKPKETPDEQPVTDRSITSPQEDNTGSQASLVTKDDKDGTPRKKVRKKKVKKAAAKTEDDEYADSGLAADLTSIEEDIIKDEEKEDIELPQTTNVGGLRSQPMQKMYIETTRGFKTENKAKLARRLAEEEKERQVEPEITRNTSIELALQTYRILKTISLFVHGLTAGLALWQIVIVYMLSRFGNVDFLVHYQALALPVQCAAYLLLALCFVSVCDRFDIGNPTRRFVFRAVTLQNGAISVIFYLTAIILSVTVVSTDDRMHLYYTNPDLWADTQLTDSELSTWKNINTARGLFAMLGWLVLSITPRADRLSKNLREGDDDDDDLLGKNTAAVSQA